MDQPAKPAGKLKNVLYWVATLWLALGMVSSGIMQLIQHPADAKLFDRLGYPHYFMPILAVWKFLGVVAVLLPGLALVKEWAYAGFFFAMSGALVSHLVVGSAFMPDVFGPLLLLVLTAASWYLRPASRKIPQAV